MDLLFKRYADPFSLIDGYIKTARFCEFIKSFAEQVAEDEKWDFYLHRVWDKSYPEYCEALKNSQALRNMSENDMEATVKQSINILGNFTPLATEEGEL
jgi:hypothetical protein